MPKDDFDQDDPFELVGMVMPEAGADTLTEMGRCFIEEYIRMGWDDESVLALFQSPFYQGPHLVYEKKGEEFIRRLISEVTQDWNASWKK
jgi:hypothetical protein